MAHEHLAESLGRLLSGRVHELRRLSGGASRETWSFDLEPSQGGDRKALILRRDPPGAARPQGMEREAALLRAAAVEGVPVPEVLEASDDPSAVGSPFVVMTRLEGETIPRRLLRDDAYARVRTGLAAECGRVLARIHRIPPTAVPGLPTGDELAAWRGHLRDLGDPHPAFELALRRLDAERPPPRPPVVVHGDFRNGNLLVHPTGLRAVLDWELAHLGDPVEDLGWLCVKAWRFGAPLPVGGFGTVDDLIVAYRDESGTDVDLGALRWWQALGTVKWGVMCIIQARAHLSGAVRSVELATIGRRVCENEWDVLELLESDAVAAALADPPPAALDDPAAGEPARLHGRPSPLAGLHGRPSPLAGLHGRPSASELVEAVRELLEGELRAGTSGRLQYLTRVAANALGMVERELAAGPEPSRQHRELLGELGVADEAELASAIRTGELDHRTDDVAGVVARTVRARLAVANPRHLRDPRTH